MYRVENCMFMDQVGVWERNNRVVAGFREVLHVLRWRAIETEKTDGIRDLLEDKLCMVFLNFFLEGSIGAVGRHGDQRGLGSEANRKDDGVFGLWNVRCYSRSVSVELPRYVRVSSDGDARTLYCMMHSSSS